MVDLNIQNGQGITQAIKAKLINDGLIDSSTKISTSVWNEIVKQVQNQNSQDIQNGKSSIYSGGSDIKGAASKNFVVKTGVVELSQEVWNNICSLFTGQSAKSDIKNGAKQVQSEAPADASIVAQKNNQAKPQQSVLEQSFKFADTGFVTETFLDGSNVVPKNTSQEALFVKMETVVVDGTKLNKEIKGALTNYYADDSGRLVRSEVDKGSGYIVKTIYNYDDETGQLAYETVINPDNTSEVHYYDEDGKLTSIKDINILDEKENITQTTRYDNDTLLSETKYENNADGNTVSSITKFYEGGKVSSIDHDIYSDENITHTDTYDSDGKTLISQTDFTFDVDGNTESTVVRFYEGGKVSSINHNIYSGENITHKDTYDSDGKTLISQTDFEYDNAGVENHRVEVDLKHNIRTVYEGIHAANPNGMPSEEIKYEDDGKTIKERTVRKFGPNNELKLVQKFDGVNNLLSSQADFEMDDYIGTAYQGTGNCYLLSAINSLANNEKGQELLMQNISKSKDENGQNVYTVIFPGAEIASADLKTRLPEDKVYIKGSYTVTQEEIDQAYRDMKYSNGDPNVLLYEIAFNKYRIDVQSTVKDNNINPEETKHYAGLCVGTDENNPIDGGFDAEATFILTGNKPICWYYESSDEPNIALYLDDTTHDFKVVNGTTKETTKPEVGKDKDYTSLSGFMESAQWTTDINVRKQILEDLIKEAQDGKLDLNSATCSFKVLYPGETKPSDHTLAIVNINNDFVTLVDPNDKTSEDGKRGEYKIPISVILSVSNMMSQTKLS